MTKRELIFILSFVVGFVVLCLFAHIKPKCIKGDMNSDGQVTITDLVLLRQQLADEKYDLNDDGEVDLLDLLILRKHLIERREE
jgi:hypothetical protein